MEERISPPEPNLRRYMHVIVCAGIHDPRLTQSFLKPLLAQTNRMQTDPPPDPQKPLIFPVEKLPPYSGPHVLWFVHQQLSAIYPDRLLQIPLVFIGFSAGVVGAIGAAWGWQMMGGTVKAFIAVDGWGVPLAGSFPIHRISHDYFTHWSSALLGASADCFYADPPVEHLELWRSPQAANGWSIPANSQSKSYITAADFLIELLQQYETDRR